MTKRWGLGITWKRLVSSLAILAILISSLFLVVPTAEADTCADVLAIFARGSGQDHIDSSGSDIDHTATFFDELESRNDGSLTIETVDLDYPAPGIESFLNAKFPFFPGGYRKSVSSGVDQLEQELLDRSHCEDQKIVLGGFSQGAHVIGDALEVVASYGGIESRVVGIGMFGDPKFNPDSYAAHGTYQAPQHNRLLNSGGILGSRDEFPGFFEDRLQSWCRYMDGICENSLTDAVMHMPAHTESYQNREIPTFINQVADSIAGLSYEPTYEYSPDLSENLDVMFVAENIESNLHQSRLRSMAVYHQLDDILHGLDGLSESTRFAYLGYGGGSSGLSDPDLWLQHGPFTDDIDEFINDIRDNTRDWRSNRAHPLNALVKAFEYDWRDDARKIVFLITDRGHPEEVEADTGYTLESVINTAQASEISIYPISSRLLNPDLSELDAERVARYERLADETQGIRFPGNLGSSGTTSLLHAVVNTIPIFPDIYNGRPGIVDEPGEEFIFDLSEWRNQNYYDKDIRYRWRFSSNDTTFLGPTEIVYSPTVYHQYDEPFEGFVRAQVQGEHWLGGFSRTPNILTNLIIPVDIDPDRGYVPNINTPRDFEVIVEDGSLNASWSPPDNASPARLRGYNLYTADGEELATLDSKLNGVDITNITDDHDPNILLSAISAQGESQKISPKVTVITDGEQVDNNPDENTGENVDNEESDNDQYSDDLVADIGSDGDEPEPIDQTNESERNQDQEDGLISGSGDSDFRDEQQELGIFNNDGSNLLGMFFEDRFNIIKLASISMPTADINNSRANVLGVGDENRRYIWPYLVSIFFFLSAGYLIYRRKSINFKKHISKVNR